MAAPGAAVPPEVAAQIAAARAIVEPVIFESQIYTWAVTAVLIWEFIILMPNEIKYMWFAPISPIKILYFLNRYLALPFMIIVAWLFTAKMTVAECTKWVQFEPYSLVIITCICDSILAVRTFALWGKNVALGIFLFAVVAAEVSIQSWAAAGGGPAPIAALGIEGCIWSSTLTKMNAFFAASSFVVLLTFVLTTARIIMMSLKTGRSNLLMDLLRDGALYFAIVFAVSLLNLISFVTQTPAQNPALHSPLCEVVTSVCCTRLILNMRRPQVEHSGTSSFGTSFRRGLRSQSKNAPLGEHTSDGVQINREVTVGFESHTSSTGDINEKGVAMDQAQSLHELDRINSRNSPAWDRV